MSLAVKAKIIGMPKLLQKLKVIPKVAREEIRVELARQADDIVRMMKGLVPKESHALEKSIGWTWGGKVPKGAMAVATGGKGDLTITIYAGNSEAFYARWVEWGTRAHTAGGKFAGAQIPAIPAQPFFFPAWRASKKGAKRRVRNAAKKAAIKVAAQ